MARKRFRYYLKPDATSYYRVSNGLVSTTTVRTPIISDPVEWGKVELRWIRNTKYHGVFRTFALPVTFVREAASILRHVYYSQGYEGACILEVEELNDTDQLYYEFYTGDIDFSETVDVLTGVQVAVLDNGLAALLKSKETTPFSIPILDADSLKVYMDGVRVKNRSVFSATSIMQATSVDARQYTPTMEHTLSEAPYLQDITTSITLDTSTPATLATNRFFYKASYPGTVRVKFSGTISVVQSTPFLTNNGLEIAIFRNSSAQTIIPLYQGAPIPVTMTSFSVTLTQQALDIPVVAGDTLTLIIGINPYGTTSSGRYFFDSTNGKLEVEYFLRRAPFVVSAYRQSQVWSKIISAMSNGAYGFVSGYLTNTALRNYGNNPWNTLLTCGDAARGLTAAVTGTPATLKITLNDLALDGSGRDMTGIGVEGSNIRYERQEYFYDNTTVIITLDEVSKFQKSVSKEHLYNLLRIGYKYQSNDTLNGKDDPHTTQAWASAGVRVNKEEDMISPFIASMYEWEYIRANLSEKNTTDDAGDNNILVVEVNGQNASGQYLLYRPQNMLGNSVTGLVAGDTAFNLTLLPKYNLLRNGPRNHTALHLMDNTSLKFQSADQNTEVQTKITGSTIVEKSDVPVSSMPSPLFLPIIFQFETPVPPGFHALINNNPYGRINFRVRHPLTNELLTFGGFIDEVNIKPADRSVCQWKLLAAPDTDLDKLNY